MIVISKTFTTTETMLNARTVRCGEWAAVGSVVLWLSWSGWRSRGMWVGGRLPNTGDFRLAVAHLPGPHRTWLTAEVGQEAVAKPMVAGLTSDRFSFVPSPALHRTWLTAELGQEAVAKHMVAVSTNLKLVKEFGIDPEVG